MANISLLEWGLAIIMLFVLQLCRPCLASSGGVFKSSRMMDVEEWVPNTIQDSAITIEDHVASVRADWPQKDVTEQTTGGALQTMNSFFMSFMPKVITREDSECFIGIDGRLMAVTAGDIATFDGEGGSWLFCAPTGSVVQVPARLISLPASNVAASSSDEDPTDDPALDANTIIVNVEDFIDGILADDEKDEHRYRDTDWPLDDSVAAAEEGYKAFVADGLVDSWMALKRAEYELAHLAIVKCANADKCNIDGAVEAALELDEDVLHMFLERVVMRDMGVADIVVDKAREFVADTGLQMFDFLAGAWGQVLEFLSSTWTGMMSLWRGLLAGIVSMVHGTHAIIYRFGGLASDLYSRTSQYAIVVTTVMIADSIFIFWGLCFMRRCIRDRDRQIAVLRATLAELKAKLEAETSDRPRADNGAAAGAIARPVTLWKNGEMRRIVKGSGTPSTNKEKTERRPRCPKRKGCRRPADYDPSRDRVNH